MKTSVVSTPTSAASRIRSIVSSASAAAARERSEGRGDSCYFPGCRKDTNCHCDICLASIDATRDLIPSGSTIQQSSISKLSVLRPTTAVPFDAESPPSTPQIGSSVTPPATPSTDSSHSIGDYESEEEEFVKEGSWMLGTWISRVLVGLFLLWAVDFGLFAVIASGFSPKLTPEAVRLIGEESRVFGKDLNGRLAIVQQRMEGLVLGRVSNCSSADSLWELNQESHFLFQWRCLVYKSNAEKVTIWGSPLRTSGLLATGFSSKSMTVLSGKITEWSDGKLSTTMRTSSNSSSWTHGMWSSAALQLDADTWVLEYEKSALFEGRGVISATMEALRFGVSKKVKKLKLQHLRLLILDSCFGPRYRNRRRKYLTPPT